MINYRKKFKQEIEVLRDFNSNLKVILKYNYAAYAICAAFMTSMKV